VEGRDEEINCSTAASEDGVPHSHTSDSDHGHRSCDIQDKINHKRALQGKSKHEEGLSYNAIQTPGSRA
jgi:hypothetical protein